MQPVQNITVDDRVSRTQYQYTLEDPDVDELDSVGQPVRGQAAEVAVARRCRHRSADRRVDGVAGHRPGLRFAAGHRPLHPRQTLYDAYGQRQINTMYTQLNQYHVIMEAQPELHQRSRQAEQDLHPGQRIFGRLRRGGQHFLLRLRLGHRRDPMPPPTSALYTPSSGVLTPPQNVLAPRRQRTTGSSSANTTTSSTLSNAVPLGAFAHMEPGTESLSINHQGQFPSVTVSFNLAPNASLGEAIDDINKAAKDMNFPASVQAGFQGTAAAFENSLSNEALLILAALVTVYIVLGVLYESFIHPITILSTLPSAGVGALLSLMLFKQNLSVVAIIGIILLIGIVKKNGIMMVDFALEGERQRGLDSTEAIYEASLLRFRPIMMTTMAALLGGIPLAVGTGIGSELRRPLGIAMVGGLLLSQVLTLYTTPVIYIFFDNLAQTILPLAPADQAQVPEPAARG